MRNVPEMKPMITANWKNRLALMDHLTKRKASASLHKAVEQVMRNSQDSEESKEETARQILQTIKPCKTETEIIKAIQAIFKGHC